MYASLGSDAAQLIQAAQREGERSGLSQELLDAEVNGWPIGSHPAFIKRMAQRTRM